MGESSSPAGTRQNINYQGPCRSGTHPHRVLDTTASSSTHRAGPGVWVPHASIAVPGPAAVSEVPAVFWRHPHLRADHT